LTAASSHLLYQEPDENVGPYNEKRLIEQSWWSPSIRRILFLDYYSIFGGTLNCLNLINSGGGDPITLYCAKSASYDPLWSPDGEWLLLDLEQQYSSPPDDGEYGDVFLFNAENGIRYQLTNTSAVAEGNLRWALAGEQIQFAADENEITINMADIIGLADDSFPSNVPATVEPLILEREPLGIVEYLSPDGKYVAYIVAEDDWKLYLAHADGTDAAFIDTVNSTIDFLGWRP
jgi:hypothetical protein